MKHAREISIRQHIMSCLRSVSLNMFRTSSRILFALPRRCLRRPAGYWPSPAFPPQLIGFLSALRCGPPGFRPRSRRGPPGFGGVTLLLKAFAGSALRPIGFLSALRCGPPGLGGVTLLLKAFAGSALRPAGLSSALPLPAG